MIAGSATVRSLKSFEIGKRGLGGLLPDAADANVCVGSKVEPRGFAARRIDDEKRIGFRRRCVARQSRVVQLWTRRRRSHPPRLAEGLLGPAFRFQSSLSSVR